MVVYPQVSSITDLWLAMQNKKVSEIVFVVSALSLECHDFQLRKDKLC